MERKIKVNLKEKATQVQPATQIYLLRVVPAKPYLSMISCLENILTSFLNIRYFQTFNKPLKIEILFVQCGGLRLLQTDPVTEETDPHVCGGQTVVCDRLGQD